MIASKIVLAGRNSETFDYLSSRGDLRDLLIDWQAERFEANTNKISKYVHSGEA